MPRPDDGCRSARTLDISRVAPDELPRQLFAVGIAVRDCDDPQPPAVKDAQRRPVGEIGHGASHHSLQGRLPVNRLRHPTARFGQKPDPFTAQLRLLPGPIGLGASLFCLEASVLGPDLSRFGIRAGHQGFPQPCRLVLLALPAVRHVTHPRLYYPRSPRLYTAQVWGAARGRRYRTVTYSPLLSSSAG